MCSNSKCDVAGLINGPVGDLVGKGIKALVNGIPIGPRNAETAQKPKEIENIQRFYDNIEAHLKGALQVLQPALEINRILLSECKSAGREKSASCCNTPPVYYTPQNTRKSRVNQCAARCCGPKKITEKCAIEKTSSSTRSCSSNVRSAGKNTPKQQNDSTRIAHCSNKLKNNVPTLNFSPIKKQSNDKYSPAGNENRKNDERSSKKLCKSKQACATCNVSLKDNSLLAVLPCKHLFCYTCLAKAKFPKCPKCDQSFDMKNVTQVYTNF